VRGEALEVRGRAVDVELGVAEQGRRQVADRPGDEDAVAGEVEPDVADAVAVGGVEPGVTE